MIFSKVTAKTELAYEEAGAIKLAEFKKWQNFTEVWNRRAPRNMQGLRQTTPMWPRIVTEKALLRNALSGVAISMLFAFVILLYATGNIIQSVLSIFCVSLVITSIVALLHLSG